MVTVLGFLWVRFLYLGLVGRIIAVIVVLYGSAWFAGTLGLTGPARSLASAAILIASLLVTAGFIRLVWRLSRKPGQ